MKDWSEKYPVEYSSASDENIDSWVQKYIAEIARIYELMNRLRRLDAKAGEPDDTVAYQWHFDTVTDKLYLRNPADTAWIEIGMLSKSKNKFVFTGAVQNNGGVASLQTGLLADMPTEELDNAIYIATDATKKSGRLYRYDSALSKWKEFCMMLYSDIDGKIIGDLAGKADEATHADSATNAFHAQVADEVVHARTTEKLFTPVKINGVPFDGSRSINIGIAGEGQEAISGYQSLLWRTAQNEREISNINLALEDMQIYPDYNNLLAETFTGALDDVDMNVIPVTSCISGDDSINVSSLNDIKIGQTYTLADGAKQEEVQIKAIAKNGNTNRALLTKPVDNIYNLDSTSLYRTTSTISDNKAIGTGTSRNTAWYPNEIWSGINASTEVLLDMPNSIDSYIVEGNVGIAISNGNLTLA